MMQIDNKIESTNQANHMISDRSVFEKCSLSGDNGLVSIMIGLINYPSCAGVVSNSPAD